MFPTYSTHQVSSVTELRQDTNDILNHADTTGEAILIQRNNDPVAVLLSVDAYKRLLARAEQPSS